MEEPAQVRLNPSNSIAAKLFGVISILVITTIVGVSVQHGFSFMKYQRDQLEDTLQQQAEQTAAQVERVIETVRAKVAVALPTLVGGAGIDAEDALKRFAAASPDVIAIHLFEAPSATSVNFTKRGEAFTPNWTDARFEDRIVQKLPDQIRGELLGWLKKKAPQAGSDSILIDSIARQLRIPAMAMAIRFQTSNQNVVWATFALWQTDILQLLPKSKFFNSALVDNNGRIFSSPSLAEMSAQRPFKSEVLVKAALSTAKPSGFVPEYLDGDGKRRFGAFARLQKFGTTVLIEQDAEVALGTLLRNWLVMSFVAGLFLLFSIPASWLFAKGITRGLREVVTATTRIAAGDLSYQIQPRTRDEVGQLSVAVNHMAQKIGNLMSSQVEKARFEKELETAKIVQSTFFPKRKISRPDLTLIGFYQPASECGGDLWGHFPIDEMRDFVYIADAMGHGAPAALVTAMAYSLNMTLAELARDNALVLDSPASILRRLNRIINDAVNGTISMTFFGAIIDRSTGEMTYSNGGHNFPVLIPASPDDPRVANNKPVRKNLNVKLLSLKQSGAPLGIDLDSVYEDRKVQLAPGDKLFLFTDGLIECSSPEGKVWGRKYLLDQIAETAAAPAAEMKDEVLARAFTFFGTKPLEDDVTVVVIELAKTWAAASPAQIAAAETPDPRSDVTPDPESPPAHPDPSPSVVPDEITPEPLADEVWTTGGTPDLHQLPPPPPPRLVMAEVTPDATADAWPDAGPEPVLDILAESADEDIAAAMGLTDHVVEAADSTGPVESLSDVAPAATNPVVEVPSVAAATEPAPARNKYKLKLKSS